MATKTKSGKTTTRKNRHNNTKAQSLADQLSSGYEILGEFITLGSRTDADKRSYLYSDVVKALSDADLDPKVAKQFLARHAFSRACAKLSEDRIIDVVREDKTDVVFQFSKKHHTTGDEGAEVEYRKEVLVTLDKDTGFVSCKDPQVKVRAQAELDRAMETRTNTDVSNIAMKLFDQHSELMAVPGAIGVYFVPKEHAEPAMKIVQFLRNLGRRPFAFPVPSGTKTGDQSVQETVSGYLGNLVGELKTAVDGFTVHTRGDAIEGAAEKIKTTRTKVEAYAHYLGDMAKDLLESVDKADEDLTTKVQKIAEDRNSMTSDELEESGAPGLANAKVLDVLIRGVAKSFGQIVSETGLRAKQVRYAYLSKLVTDGVAIRTSEGWLLA